MLEVAGGILLAVLVLRFLPELGAIGAAIAGVALVAIAGALLWWFLSGLQWRDVAALAGLAGFTGLMWWAGERTVPKAKRRR